MALYHSVYRSAETDKHAAKTSLFTKRQKAAFLKARGALSCFHRLGHRPSMSETNERPAVSACEGKTAPDFVLRDGDQQRLQQEVQGTGHLSSDSAAVSMLQPRGELTKQPDDAAHPPEEGGSGACLDAAPGTGGSAPLHNAVDQAAGGDGGSSGPHEDRAGTDIGAAQGAAEQDPSSKSTFQAGEDKASLDSGSERRGVSTAPDTDSHQPAAPAATDAQQEPGRGGDQTLGKRARRPSSKAFQDEVAAAKPASEELKTPKLLEKGAAKAVGERQLRATKPLEADALLSTSPEAQCLTLLRGKNNRVWRNGRWHRMTAEGIPVICEKRMREGLEESGSAKRTRTSNVRRPAGEPGDAARKLRMPRRERPDRTPCQNAPDNLPLGPRQQRVKVPKDALCATRTAQQWKMTKSGSTSGGTQYLDQVCVVTRSRVFTDATGSSSGGLISRLMPGRCIWLHTCTINFAMCPSGFSLLPPGIHCLYSSAGGFPAFPFMRFSSFPCTQRFLRACRCLVLFLVQLRFRSAECTVSVVLCMTQTPFSPALRVFESACTWLHVYTLEARV
jgi:hypothetical protein